tara:strand:+ start:65 stop:310 length:246 start_codon:yes stop_codon:yes gene_type:complete
MAVSKIPALIKKGKMGLKGDLKRLAEIKLEFEKFIKLKPSDKFGKSTVEYSRGVDSKSLTERYIDEMFDIYQRINKKLGKK